MSASGIAFTMSANGVISSRNGATARFPASMSSPQYTSSAMITGSPWNCSGTNGIGGDGMTFAMVDSSSGAALAASTKEAITSAVAGRTNMPPYTFRTGSSRY